MVKSIRIGTRDSTLALWQAKAVADVLYAITESTEIVPVKSKGDLDLQTPLHQMGGTGIFTKVLDEILLSGKIDIAVHSLKDYPTVMPAGIKLAAVLPREDYRDILVLKNSADFLTSDTGLVATGSIRRRAQWLNKYPGHQLTNLRGNVQTRLQKLQNNDWNGAVFAKAGLLRLGLVPDNAIELDWMIPAPAQGVVAITCRADDHNLFELLQKINHRESWDTSLFERQFLNTLEGGCSAPIGALAKKTPDGYDFCGGVFSLDGKKKVVIEESYPSENPVKLGARAAEVVRQKGGNLLMKEIRETL
ncbi:MAG: hydroxymethylbilane synthase [Cryomorphaceae bacterium]|nr:hydroxymethylbilane synthase [Cryomorphaceae bacterium]